MDQEPVTPAIRIVIAAPFPEIVGLHERAAEYADELDVCGAVTDATGVVDQTRVLQPEVLVLSDRLGVEASDVAARLAAVAPTTRLVLLQTSPDNGTPAGLADAVLDAGASAGALRSTILRAAGRLLPETAPPAHGREAQQLVDTDAQSLWFWESPAPAGDEQEELTAVRTETAAADPSPRSDEEVDSPATASAEAPAEPGTRRWPPPWFRVLPGIGPEAASEQAATQPGAAVVTTGAGAAPDTEATAEAAAPLAAEPGQGWAQRSDGGPSSIDADAPSDDVTVPGWRTRDRVTSSIEQPRTAVHSDVAASPPAPELESNEHPEPEATAPLLPPGPDPDVPDAVAGPGESISTPTEVVVPAPAVVSGHDPAVVPEGAAVAPSAVVADADATALLTPTVEPGIEPGPIAPPQEPSPAPTPAPAEAPAPTPAAATAAAAPAEPEPEPIPEQPRRRIRRPGRARAEIVLVFSGKGGVGKSVMATNLAVALSKRGAAVAIVDLNLQYGDVGVLLHLESHTTSIESLAQQGEQIDREFLDEVMAPGPEEVRALLAPTSPEFADLVTAASLRAILRELGRTYDYIIVDSASHLEELVLEVMEIADQILMVTTFNITAVKDTKITLKLLQSLGIERERIAVVLNQTRAKISFPRSDIEKSLRFAMLAHLPFEPRIDDTIDAGRPMVISEPRSEFAKQINLVVDYLAPDEAVSAADDRQKGKRRFGFGR